MILYINTIGKDAIEVKIKLKERFFSSGKIPAERTQAELLLPVIEKLLKKNKDLQGKIRYKTDNLKTLMWVELER